MPAIPHPAVGLRKSLDLVALAAGLGYSDQAHLTRDFASLVGEPPCRYAKVQ